MFWDSDHSSLASEANLMTLIFKSDECCSSLINGDHLRRWAAENWKFPLIFVDHEVWHRSRTPARRRNPLNQIIWWIQISIRFCRRRRITAATATTRAANGRSCRPDHRSTIRRWWERSQPNTTTIPMSECSCSSPCRAVRLRAIFLSKNGKKLRADSKLFIFKCLKLHTFAVYQRPKQRSWNPGSSRYVKRRRPTRKSLVHLHR